MNNLESKFDPLYDSRSSITTRQQSSQIGSEHPTDVKLTTTTTPHQFDPDLVCTLNASRVYIRTAYRLSMLSLISRHESIAGTTIFTGLSLAKLSDLSVISLPIYSHELLQSQTYQHVTKTRTSLQENALHWGTFDRPLFPISANFPRKILSDEIGKSAEPKSNNYFSIAFMGIYPTVISGRRIDPANPTTFLRVAIIR